MENLNAEQIHESIDYFEDVLKNWTQWQTHHTRLTQAIKDAIVTIKELTEERKDFEIRALRAENEAAMYKDRWETSKKDFERLADENERLRAVGENITKNHPVDEFICSECGFITRDCCRYEIDEDADGDETCYEFAYKYCPRCGAKIKGE